MKAPHAKEEIPDALRREVRLLGTVLGHVLRESAGSDLLDEVERIRLAAIAFRGVPNETRRVAVMDLVDDLDADRAELVARAFTVYFQLVNLAEQHQRMRALRERAHRGEPPRHSLEETVGRLRDELGEDQLAELLGRLEITNVITAHPTEARRRAVVETLRRVAAQLERLDDPRLAPAERADVERRLHEEIAALWHTDQLRQDRPEPLDEVRAAMWLFDETIFTLAPAFYRELDRALGPDADGRGSGLRPPAFDAFLRWGSWIGGDRDGNPRVTSEVTRQVLDVHADHVLRGLERTTRRIARELSASERDVPPSEELLHSLEEDAQVFPQLAKDLARKLPDAPHRRKLTLCAERLVPTPSGIADGYPSPSSLLADLAIVQRSLVAGGADRLAYGELQHLAWQVETFGFHLAALEIRQHADVHATALAELHDDAASAQTDEVLATLRVMAQLQRRFGPQACRRYVVSFSTSAADVLAVHELARIAVPDGSLAIDVVPLFESRADLQRAPKILDDLISDPEFARRLQTRGRRLEVMLGYSDSAKDVGFLAANLALYEAQRNLAAWARRNDVRLTLFHGRGGALGRGGGPAGRAILGQAPGSVDGRFKVTEQGEVVVERYGDRRVALRHLEQVTSAVLTVSTPEAIRAADVEERFDVPAREIAVASERAWRDLVEREGFAGYFARVTPITELSELAIGSRPARRDAGEGLDRLRAIPWVFAWSQNRCNLPGWYGLGTGLAAIDIDVLRAMYEQWPFFTSVLENAQLSLAKADLPIAELYLALGEDDEVRRAIKQEYERTVDLVLRVTRQEAVLEPRVVLRRAIELRNPYVDALSFLQVRFLRELRAAQGENEAQSRRLVQLTINGIAAGLQNTG
ncbi:MAG: phosphoenolpyruvate carboxylase [Actinomycetota bacterium]